MEKLKLYLDTTVWNFAFAVDSPVYQADTLGFFQRVRLGLFEVFYSEAVTGEVGVAPISRRTLIEKLLREIKPQKLKPQKEIQALADEYIKNGVLPK